MKDYFIHKEPVLNRRKAVYGQELLFRRPAPNSPQNGWVDTRLTEGIMSITPADSFEKFAANKHIFLSLEPASLEQNLDHHIPRRSVLQFAETYITDKLVAFRAETLKKIGYQLAVDYSLAAKGLMPSRQAFDIVRINTMEAGMDAIASAVAGFKNAAFKVMATNIPDIDTFNGLTAMDIDLFQGPFFLNKPQAPPEPISYSQTALMSLSRDLKQNRDIEVIEQTFKGSPKLTFGLLTLMNSAYMGVRQKVTSIRQAIALLGYAALEKWVVMLLFTVDHTNDQTNPLVEKAVLRGMIMDRLAKKTGLKAMADSAFMTGMLSLFTYLFNVKIDELTQTMFLGDDIKDALLKQEGYLGSLLSVVEKLDRQEYHLMSEDLANLHLNLSDVFSAETDSIFDCQGFFFRD
jgi:c-di-GMP-related signal transduction protein